MQKALTINFLRWPEKWSLKSEYVYLFSRRNKLNPENSKFMKLLEIRIVKGSHRGKASMTGAAAEKAKRCSNRSSSSRSRKGKRLQQPAAAAPSFLIPSLSGPAAACTLYQLVCSGR